MKYRHSSWVVTVGIALFTFTHPVSATEKEEMPKRVIVQVKGTQAEGIEGDVISTKNNQRETLLQVDVPTGQSTASFIKELKSEPDVIRAEEDRLLQMAYTPGDPYYYGQYHHQTIHTSEAWDRSMGSNVTVAILDNGIDMNHEDLMGKIVDPYDVTYDSPYTLSMGDHGTHVAGIVGSAVENGYGGVGVAPAASIMPIDVFAGSSAYTSEVIEGVYRAVDRGANIINMSLGNYSYSTFFQDAINYAYDHNVVVVAAAGNDATSLTHYPSSYDHVLSVGSTTQDDTLSYFSNYGPYVDITAPGSDILSTTPYNFYETYSGTSMASPVVAGVAALVKSYEPGLSVDDITYRLTSTTDDLGSAGRDDSYGSGRVNAKAALQIREVAPPVINEFSDASNAVTGTVPLGNGYGRVIIYDAWGYTVAWEDYLMGGDYFTISTPPYKAGTNLKAAFYDYSGDMSPYTTFTVLDRTPPAEPAVVEMSDKGEYLIGYTDPYSYVEVESSMSGFLTSGYADSIGQFVFYIGKQTAGSDLFIHSVDMAGNMSPTATIHISDMTPPVISSLDDVTDQSTEVSGYTEPYVHISVFDSKEKMVGEGESDANGHFSIPIERLTSNQLVSFIATDQAGNVAEKVSTTVLDRTAPVITKINEVSDQSTNVSGVTEAGVTLIVKKNGNELVRGKSDDKGIFSLAISKQVAKEKLTIVAVDAANNSSEEKVMTVTDKTAPTAPRVNEVTDLSTTVTGTTEKNAKVILRKNKEELARTTADAAGQFALTVAKQVAGTELSIIVQDEAGNASAPLSIIVVDKTAPAKPTIEPVTDLLDTIKGTAEANSIVTVKTGTTVLGKITLKEDGRYTMVIGKQKAGTVLSVTSTDKAGNVSQAVETKVLDRTAPAVPVVTEVTDQSTSVKGTGEAGSTVTVKVGSKELVKGTVDTNGTFTFVIPKQTVGTVLAIISTDAAGNVSKTLEVKVLDRTAPLAPTLSEVTDQTTVISGKAEANAVISVKVKSVEIGKTTVGKDGAFKVTIPKQTAGTTLTMTATDGAGNISSAVTVLVADKTAPPLQVDQITNRSVVVTGTTEAKAKVRLVYATKTMETTANSNGKFSFSVTTPKTGASFSFTVSDTAGNKSDVLTLKALDATLPILKGITDATIEAGTLFDPKAKVTAVDETDGDLTKSISIAGKIENKKPGLYRLTYSVKDKAGNETKQIRNVTVKDTVKPVISGAKNQSINLNSSFNAKSGVTANDNIDGVITKNIKISGTVNVKKVGAYTLTYKVSDASGNTVTTLRKITVKDNVKPTISGAKSKTIKYKSSFNPKMGVTAKDNVDGVLTKSIKVKGTVNTKRKGTYALTYSVKDKAGNSTSVKIKITVK